MATNKARKREQDRERQRRYREKQRIAQQRADAIKEMEWAAQQPVQYNPVDAYRFLVAEGYMPKDAPWETLPDAMSLMFHELIEKKRDTTDLVWSLGMFFDLRDKKKRERREREKQRAGAGNLRLQDMFLAEEMDGISVRKGA